MNRYRNGPVSVHPASVLGDVTAGTRHTLREVAVLLDVHLATVWRWVLRGVRGRRLSTVMVGGRRYILARDLEAFLDPCDEPASHTAPRPDDLAHRSDATASQLDRLGI